MMKIAKAFLAHQRYPFESVDSSYQSILSKPKERGVVFRVGSRRRESPLKYRDTYLIGTI